MDLFLLVSCFILMLAVLYLLLSRKVSHATDKVLKEHYKTQYRQDMIEFYREMENYAMLFENKIHHFKKLLDRQSDQIEIWKMILSKIKTTKKAKEIIEEVNSMVEKGEFINPVPLKSRSLEKSEDTQLMKENKPAESQPDQAHDQEGSEPIAEQVIDDLMTKQEGSEPIAEQVIDDLMTKQEGSELIAEQVIDDLITKEEGTSKVSNDISTEDKNFSDMVDRQMEVQRQEPKQNVQEPNPTKAIKQEQTETDEQSLLGTDDLLLLLQDLSDSKKKPKALQVLLDQGYKISEISDMAEIAHSDLEATKNIYNLESKDY